VNGDIALPSSNKFILGTPASLGNGEYIQNSVAGPGYGIGFYTSSSQKMVLTGSGNLGVGTGTVSLPTERLDVAGNVKFSGALMPNNTAGTAGQYLMSKGTGSAPVWTTVASAGWNLGGNAGTSPGTDFIGTTDAKNLELRTNNVMAMQISTAGNIGIGASASSPKLFVDATTTLNTHAILGNLNYNPANAGGGVVAGGYFSNNTNSNGGGTQFNTAVTGYLSLNGNNSSTFNIGGWLHAITTGGNHSRVAGVMGSLEIYGGSTTINSAYGGYFEHFVNNGNVTNGYGIYVGSVTGTNKWSVYSADATAPSYFAGRVGIGSISTPSSVLSVGDTPFDFQAPTMRVYASSGLPWQGNAAIGGTMASVMMGQLNDVATIGGHSGNLGAWSDLVINPYGGNVGVNTGSNMPTAALHISGSMRYEDGNEGIGKVLTSDAQGNVSWQTAGAFTGWGLGGNSGTTPGTHFIGTTDAQNLVFKTNNTNWMEMDVIGHVGLNATPTASDNLFAYRESTVTGAGISTIKGYRDGINNPFGGGGTGWGVQEVDAAVVGASFWGNAFSAGMAGFNYNDYGNSAGVLGSQYNANYWGALAFNDGINQWGVYTPYNTYLGGNVGINNTSPVANLDLTGTFRLSDGTEGAGKVLTSDGAGNASWQTATGGGWGLSGNSGTNPGTDFIGTTDPTDLIIGTNSSPAIIVNKLGNVGMGTLTPQALLQVDALSTDRAGVIISNGRDVIGGAMPLTISVNTVGQTYGVDTYARTLRFNNTISGKIYDFGYSSTGDLYLSRGNVYSNPDFVVSSTGNIGIGTLGATAKFHVKGTTRLQDGTEGAGKVLTSDASGNASWQTIGTSSSSICFIKDVKTSGTSGGAFSSGVWQTRTLNTVEGNASLVTLASNQFVLQPGTYMIVANVPAYSVDLHKARLRNITDGTDILLGTSCYASNTGGAENASVIEGVFTITSAKTFEIQHRCSTSQSPNGFGSGTSFGVSEVYTQIQITKLN
jgi:hypothetical protein